MNEPKPGRPALRGAGNSTTNTGNKKMALANEIKSTLSQFNKGIKNVTIEDGIVCVNVASQKTAFSVQLDLLRSRAFRSVKVVANAAAGKGFIVFGAK
jgi:hypothetical protein